MPKSPFKWSDYGFELDGPPQLGDENQANTGISITGNKILTNYEQYLVTNTRTLSPNLVNEARFGYTRLSNSLGTYSA